MSCKFVLEAWSKIHPLVTIYAGTAHLHIHIPKYIQVRMKVDELYSFLSKEIEGF